MKRTSMNVTPQNDCGQCVGGNGFSRVSLYSTRSASSRHRNLKERRSRLIILKVFLCLSLSSRVAPRVSLHFEYTLRKKGHQQIFMVSSALDLFHVSLSPFSCLLRLIVIVFEAVVALYFQRTLISNTS